MTRILVAGLAPLPFEATLKNYGPGARTWQLARGLAAGGHEVAIVAMRIRDAYSGSAGEGRERVDGIDILRVEDADFLHGDAVAREIDRFRPDAVVGATIYGSHALARSAPATPFWADQFGHVMAEAQAKAALDGENRVLPYFWGMLEPVLRSADKISVVSTRQRFAAIGELGALGRLSAETCGYEFIEVIPCAQPASVGPGPGRGFLRGRLVPDDAFVAIWSGTYNVWSDVDVLFDALSQAMNEEPRIHFVSTGGEIPGHDEATYARLVGRARSSPLANRFHLLGWLPPGDVERVWGDADLGVLTERSIYEGELGSKNRIVHWMAFGLPVLYNRVGDLGDLLVAEALGEVFPVGDARAMARSLVAIARDATVARERARTAQRFVEEQLSYEATTAGLRRWAAAPSRAPGSTATYGAKASPRDHATTAQAAAATLQRAAPRLADRLRRWWRRPATD